MTILKISNTRWHTCLTNLSHSIFQHYVKIVQIRSIFWSVFSCIRTEHRKYGPENTPSLDIFHAVQRICLYILMDILKYTLTVVLYYKIMNLYNKVLITFSWLILPQNVIKQHLCDIATYIISDNILLTRSLSLVDSISERANIIVVMDEYNGVYLMSQVHLFDTSKTEFMERKGIKT